MEFSTTNPSYLYGRPEYRFKHHYHPYLVRFIMNNDRYYVAHRLRIALVLADTDRLSFREDVPVHWIHEAIQEELYLNYDELQFYASLGCFTASELLAERWNTTEGIQQMLDALHKLFRRM